MQGHRHAAIGRISLLAVVAVLALTTAPAGRLPATALGVAAALAGASVYSSRLLSGRLRGLPTLDLVVVCLVCLGQSWTVSPNMSRDHPNWVWYAATVAVVAYQWHTTSREGATTIVVVTLAYLIGSVPTGDVAWPRALWLLVTATLSRALYLRVRQGGRQADAVRGRRERVRRTLTVHRARRTDAREHLAALHDTAASTLLMVGMGAVDGREHLPARQARRDLAVLRSARPDTTTRETAPDELLAGVVRHSGVRVAVTRSGTTPLPAGVTEALRGSVREALTNVARHAGVGDAEVRVERDADAVTVTVSDSGRGFVPADVPAARRGVSDSIVARMASVGGRAYVDSAPGRGTLVRLEWSASEPDIAASAAVEPRAAEEFAEPTADYFLHGLRVAALTIAVVTLFVWELPMLLGNIDHYASPTRQFLAFGGTVVVAAGCAVPVACRRSTDRWRLPLTIVVLAMSVLSQQGVATRDLGTPAHWTFGNPGWFALVLFLGRGVAPLVVVSTVELVPTVVSLCRADGDDSGSLSAVLFGGLVFWSGQLAIGLSAKALRRTADTAMRHAAEEERMRAEHLVSESVEHDRRQRFAALEENVVPLLERLAAGELDPRAESVRRACAVEAARLRRLFAEHDDAPDPLVHELRAAIDVVERRGVVVTLAMRGRRPALAREVRRALIDPAITALAVAEATARVTVLATVGTVTVSVVADARPKHGVLVDDRARERVSVSAMTMENRLWVEATWTTKDSREPTRDASAW
ncbi:ATP-binding protein [Embleya hyalina]|uniref:Histidine kinase n=1 Tax=Embleya hyalina TaxID=516124 RepID=A0A401YDN9_9ACTN|nr:sensor histidine kinase [Embleya hyalina]GCD92705.1 histidine kinase [Embleya hyalina]